MARRNPFRLAGGAFQRHANPPTAPRPARLPAQHRLIVRNRQPSTNHHPICEDVYEVDYVGDGKTYTVGEAATELICGFYRWEKPGFGAPVADTKSVAGPSAETFFRRFGIMGNRKLA